jgi:tetratricopeptide (TPR) repeat protein
MLDERYGLAAAVSDNLRKFANAAEGDSFEEGFLYCGTCGGRRRVRATIVYSFARYRGGFTLSVGGAEEGEGFYESILKQLEPSLFLAECLQCGAEFTVVVYELAEGGPGVVALAASSGGLNSPHTPPAVTYYLDQARRAESVGANSAAVAMYRSALEQLLHDQGFTARMVGPKLAQLEEAREAGTAPKWALELDPAFLGVINKLGTGSLHANRGEIALQAELDADLLQLVRETFEELLAVVYERENTRRERLALLEKRAEVFDQRHPEVGGSELEGDGLPSETVEGVE